MEKIKVDVKDHAKTNDVAEEYVINQFMEDKPEDRSCDGNWSAFQDKTEMKNVVEVKFNAGSIVFAIGLLGTLVWSFIGNAGFSSSSAPLYHVLTNEAIASASGFTAITPIVALIAISICGSVVGALFGLAVGAIVGKNERVQHSV